MKSRSPRRRPPVGLPAAIALVCAFCYVVPASAAHQARLSADLADHLAAGSQAIDVIVHGDRATVQTLATRYNVRVKKFLKDGAVLQVTAGQLDALRQDDTVDHLSGDIRIKSSLADVTAESIGADQVWSGSKDMPSLSGKGITVAVIDSGIDDRHAALARRVLHTEDFTGGDGVDRYGHGTHVAGIIAGQSGSTAETAGYRGIAAGAYLVNLRVLDETGSGTASGVIEAIDWAIDHRNEYGIRVINLSLGAPVLQPYRDDPLCEAVERAVDAGIVVVAAAGNYGRNAEGQTVLGMITSPGNDPRALTVAALDTHETPQRSDDTVAPYSSRGPTRYDLVLKPDLAAPGTHIISTESSDSYLAKTFPERHVAGAGLNAYMQLSGTSMAAAVVSGAVSLLLDERSNLTPLDVRAVLQLTTSFLPKDGLVAGGAGSLDAVAAAYFLADPFTKISTVVAGEEATPSGPLAHFIWLTLKRNTCSASPASRTAPTRT